MGRNKIKIEKIKNERIRQVTYYKRKKGLFKKAMELSVLCDIKLFLSIVDKNDKQIIFCSDCDVSSFKEKYIDFHNTAREIVTLSNYKDNIENSLIENGSFLDMESQDDINLKKKKEMKGKMKNRTEQKNTNLINDNSNDLISSQKDLSDGKIGISEVKKKLSLKVLIPDLKLTEKVKSIDSSPRNFSLSLNNEFNKKTNADCTIFNDTQFKSKTEAKKIDFSKYNFSGQNHPQTNNKEQVTPSRVIYSPNNTNSQNNHSINFNNVFSNRNVIPIINPFLLKNDNVLSYKRSRNENYLNFSPKPSAGTLIGITPLYNPLSPNPPNFFVFNNSITSTPLENKTSQENEDFAFNYKLNGNLNNSSQAKQEFSANENSKQEIKELILESIESISEKLKKGNFEIPENQNKLDENNRKSKKKKINLYLK